MKKFFFKSVLLGAILITILSILENRFDQKALEDKCRRSNWVMSFEKQHFDFAFCGDSRAYNMIHVPTIQNITQSNGINLGYTGTVFEEQYLIVKKFLENGNTIDRIYIQADLLSFDSSKRSRHQFRIYNYLPYLGKDSTITNIIQDNSKSAKFLLWRYVPLAKYIEYNLEYPITFLLKDFSNCESEFDEYGSEMKIGKSKAFMDRVNEYVPKAGDDKAKNKAKSKKPQHLNYEELVDQHTMHYFKLLVAHCLSNGITVMLYTPPLLNVNNDKTGYREELESFLGRIASERRISYTSFLTNPMCSNQEYFFDASHTNQVGTKEFSRIFAEEILTPPSE